MERVSTTLAGFQLALLPTVEAYWLENPGFTPEQEVVQTIRKTVLPQQHIEERKSYTPEQKQRKREQVGWIEERRANPKRDQPTTCYYFCWYEMQDGQRRKLKTYVPQGQMSQVWESVKVNKRPYYETLKLIQKSGRPHCTDTPRL